MTGANLTSDITITVPSSHITLSGGNVMGTSPNYTIALANANQLNSITAIWDKAANLAVGNISFASSPATTKNVAVSSTPDVEVATLSALTLSSGTLIPAFASGTYSYTASKVPADISSITVTGTATSSGESITNNGSAISAGTTSQIIGSTSYNTVNSNNYTVSWGGNYTLADWSANGSTDASLSIPSVYGWSANPAVGWIAANGSTAGTCRLIDTDINGVNSVAANGITFTYGGSNYNGRILLLRWDGGNTGRIYSYPMQLQAGTTYQITGKACAHNGASTLTFGINSTKSNSSPIVTGTVTTTTNGLLKDVSVINISVSSSGVYYLNITSSAGTLTDIADLALNVQTTTTLSGDNTWSTAAWTGGRTPLAGDDVTVSSGTLTIDQNAFAKTITVAPGAKLSLSTGKTLSASSIVLNSDETGTATFVNSGTATVTSATAKQYLTADVNEKYTSGRNWYVSSPVTAAPYTVLSSATSVQYWDEITGAWAIKSSGTLTPGAGYISVSTATTGNVTFSGTLNDGDIPVSVTRHTGVTKEGFNLIGNPYPSYLSWKAAYEDVDNISNSHVGSTIWYRTRSASGTSYKFATYNAALNVGSSVDGDNVDVVTGNIPPMQAFWVRVNEGSSTGTITFKNSMRAHKGSQIQVGGTYTDGLLRVKAANNTIQQFLRLEVSDGTNKDEAIIVFDANAQNGIDDYDSHKMSNANASMPEICSVVDNQQLVINGLNHITTGMELPLGFATGTANAFTLKATQFRNFDADTRIVLRDNLLNKEQDITNGTSYAFGSDISNTTSRFSIIFKSVGGTTAPPTVNDNNTEVVIYKNANNQIVVHCSENKGSDAVASVYNNLGQQLQSKRLVSSTTVFDAAFAPGVYVVSVNNAGKISSQKLILY